MPKICVKLPVTLVVSVRSDTRESAYEHALELIRERLREVQGPDGDGATLTVRREGYAQWADL